MRDPTKNIVIDLKYDIEKFERVICFKIKFK